MTRLFLRNELTIDIYTDMYVLQNLDVNILLRLNERISVTTSVLKDRFSKYDRGGTGDISFDDFLSLMQVKSRHIKTVSMCFVHEFHGFGK